MRKLKYVKLFENFDEENGVIIANSYSKDGFKIYHDDKNWKNKLPKVDGMYLLHNTNSKNLDSILSNGLKLKQLGDRSAQIDSYFGSDIISHRGGDASIIVIFKKDEFYKLQTGVEDGVKYNIFIKNGIIPSERILGYIHIPKTSDGRHDESLIFYPNDKFNLNVNLNIEREDVIDRYSDDNPFGLGKNIDDENDDENDTENIPDFGSEWN